MAIKAVKVNKMLKDWPPALGIGSVLVICRPYGRVRPNGVMATTTNGAGPTESVAGRGIGLEGCGCGIWWEGGGGCGGGGG